MKPVCSFTQALTPVSNFALLVLLGPHMDLIGLCRFRKRVPHFIPGGVALAKAVLDVVASLMEKTDNMQVRLINWQCLHTISLQLQLVLPNKVSGNDPSQFFASHCE